MADSNDVHGSLLSSGIQFDNMFYTLPLQLLVAASGVLASPLELASRGQAPAGQPSAVTLKEDIPQGLMKDLALKFKPWLKVDLSSCCTSWPAVSPEGITRQVLYSTRSHSLFLVADFSFSPGFGVLGDKIADCQNRTGQVYGRGINRQDSTSFNNQYAIMYTWYFPTRYVSPMEGLRHDWQQIVVWLNYNGTETNATADDFSIDRIAYSGPSGYNVWSGKTDSGTSRPMVQYYRRDNTWGVEQASEKGDEQDLVMWETFTKAAKDAVGNKSNFGGKTAPFSDATVKPDNPTWTNFLDHLQAANKPLLGRVV